MRAVTALEVVLLAALAWPWTRLVLDPRRRLARVAPSQYAALCAGLAVALVAVVAIAVRAPRALDGVTAAAAAVSAAAWWRARPSYGRSRHLPPGSLSVTRSLQAIVDRGFYAAQTARHGAVWKMAQFHRPVVCVVGLELGHEILRRHRERLGPSTLPWNHELRGGFLRYMDDQTHEVYGGLFRVALAGPVVAAGEPATRAAARRELHALADACAARRAVAGVSPDGALQAIVLAAFARVLFGIDEADPAFPALAAGYATLRAQSLSAPLGARSRAALDDLRALVERRAAELDADVARGVHHACALGEMRRASPEMPDGVCVDNLLFILKVASDNVAALLRWLVKTLGEHPAWSARLRAELDGAATAVAAGGGGAAVPSTAGAMATGARAPSLADRIVMETLRLEQSEYLYRVIREKFEHGGFVFPPRWQLRVCVRESHRSKEHWPDAATFDPDRFLGRSVTRSRYSPFGFHQHACNGVDLNNMICRVVLEELAAGYEWSIARDGDLERDFRHWSHWRPSARLAIAIRASSGHAV